LVVDDEQGFRRVVQYNLEEKGYNVLVAKDGAEALDIIHRDHPALIITDIKMPGMDGLDLLGKIRQTSQVPVIVVTAFGSVNTAAEAMRRGANDYITKPYNRDELQAAVTRCLRAAKLEDENTYLKAQLKKTFSAPSLIVGSSSAMSRVERMIEKLARNDAGVLITGESGTGKEMVAKSIHFQSDRAKNGRFIPVNCSAIPRELLESELFGHVKGSFTGAIADRVGKFESAHGGTLFLDEVGDMPLELQAKILRALQEKEIERVGGDGKSRPVDVRIIAATNRILPEMVPAGTFREDLYYRLAVVELRLPPLRERRDDIPLLAKHFLEKYSSGKDMPKLDASARDALQNYSWPGNVRELENVIQRALALLEKPGALTVDDLPDSLRYPGPKRVGKFALEIPDEGIVLDDVESGLIEAAMRKTQGNQTRAAELLGITRQTLIYRLQKYGIKGDNKNSRGTGEQEIVMEDEPQNASK